MLHTRRHILCVARDAAPPMCGKLLTLKLEVSSRVPLQGLVTVANLFHGWRPSPIASITPAWGGQTRAPGGHRRLSRQAPGVPFPGKRRRRAKSAGVRYCGHWQEFHNKTAVSAFPHQTAFFPSLVAVQKRLRRLPKGVKLHFCHKSTLSNRSLSVLIFLSESA